MKFTSSPNLAAGVATLVLVLATAGTPLFAQAPSPTSFTPTIPALTYADQMPSLPGGGGNAALVKALQKHFKYPKPASANPVQGRIVVSITVEADGSVREAKVVKSPRPDCEAAMTAAVLHLPRFIPGKQNGRPVPVVVTVPLSFMMDPVPPATAITTMQP